MMTCLPTRFLASPGGHPANTTPWPESAPHPLDEHRSLLLHTADVPKRGPAELTAIPFRAHSAAPAHHEQLSITILLPH
jgi:hypothetical protein